MFLNARTASALFAPQPFLHNSLYIGGVSLALCGSSPSEIQLHPGLSSFVDNTRSADIEVSTESVEDLYPHPAQPTFHSGALWQVFSSQDGFTFDFASERLGSHPYKRLITTRDFSAVRLLLNRRLLAPYAPIFPLEYPTDEILITNYLAIHRLGVEVHGCGLVDRTSGGQLFLGHSGAGKSTTARIWQTARRPQILSDDRIILRLDGGELRLFGTPWHGEAAFAEQGSKRLKRIFILQHGSRTCITPMSKAQAVGEVFARCFPPFHSACGLEGTLAFLERMLNAVPCYEFQFVPDQTAVEAVLNFND